MLPKHSLKLYYFGFRGRGECVRQLLKLAGVPFEDYIVKFEQWPLLKKEMPAGQIPVLEVDGIKIAQSKATLQIIKMTMSNEVFRQYRDSLGRNTVGALGFILFLFTYLNLSFFRSYSENWS